MARIFISYKRVDKEKVFPLKEQIEVMRRPSSCQFTIYPSFTGSLQLVTNRFTSTLSVEVI